MFDKNHVMLLTQNPYNEKKILFFRISIGGVTVS